MILDSKFDKRIITGSLAFFLICFLPDKAQAMHISEGILPASWAGFWFVLSIPFIIWGLADIKKRAAMNPGFKAMTAMVGAAIFIISCMPIPVPTAGTCSHPCGTGLGAILIGPGPTIVVASIGLLLQALFLAHGGLTTFGADVMSMGVGGALSGYLIFKLFRKMGLSFFIAAFAAGLISDWVTYSITSLELACALHGDVAFWDMFLAIIIAFIPTQIPLGIIEGFLSAGAFGFIKSRRPELLSLNIEGVC
ncbi:MAG: energy-coupling factor ABC transporter permease [Planctomycetes bacterium]|nr:energy-coupling factor ABC transporter permease [Planctomycetota bacterium]